jgi:glycosyltransferase involved in cell wall biosynthesis
LKLSIVTICLNSERYIRQTIESVVSQKNVDYEYIVIDGGSIDGTLDIIAEYQKEISYWESGKDNGIADAMNKSLDHVTGDYVLFLHSDDYLLNSEILSEVKSYLEEGRDIYAFCVSYLDTTKNSSRILCPRGFNWWLNIKTGILHQGALCKTELFDRYGRFDDAFNVAMDYDYFLRLYQRGVEATVVRKPLSVMRNSGVSARDDWDSLKARFLEERRVQKKYNSSFIWLCIYSVFWAAYLPYRRIKAFL